MDPLVDLLVLMGFLSGLFCVLGVMAWICEWVEQRYRLVFGLDRGQPQLRPPRVRKLSVKNAKTTSKARLAEKSVRAVQGIGAHRRAA